MNGSQLHATVLVKAIFCKKQFSNSKEKKQEQVTHGENIWLDLLKISLKTAQKNSEIIGFNPTYFGREIYKHPSLKFQKYSNNVRNVQSNNLRS